MRRIHLPSNKHKGMLIYCSATNCKKHFSRTRSSEATEPVCKLTGKKFSKCPNFDKHKYKARVHIPGTKSAKLSRTLDTRSYNEAVIKAIEFQNECQEALFDTYQEDKATGRLVYLIDGQIEYLDYLAGIGVPEHQKVARTEHYIKDVKSCLLLFNEAMSKHKVNTKLMRLDRVTDLHVGYYHAYLLREKHYSNKTYNGKMGALRSFMKWAIKHYKLKISNPFEDVKNRVVSTEKKTITKKEFQALLESIKPETGKVTLGGKRAEVKNMYRDYLKDGIELCLHTGGRREEVVEIKWNMIREVDGEPMYILMKNLKVERQLGEGFNEKVASKIIPVTKGLRNLLDRLGYDNKKDADEYIICPDRSSVTTKSIMENLSKGFTHYYKQLGTGRELQMKCLRKTYLTYLEAAMKGETPKLSSHTTEEVLHRHYIDKKIVHKAVREVEIFG